MSACETDSPNFSTAYLGTIHDLNDWGAIALDADDPNCAHTAANHLVQKLINTPTTYFQQPLAGYSIALIFSAAVRVGSYGWFNTQQDPHNSLTYQLDRITSNYVEQPNAGDCGNGFGGNSCMDDYAGEAAAWAWMAAYKYKKGDADTNTAIQNAQSRLTSFFNDVCIYSQANFDAGNHAVCNGSVTDLENNTGFVFAYEHTFESPHYAFGLLTSISSAVTGLQAAGSSYPLSYEQQWLVRGMWGEIQMHIQDWTTSCRKPVLNTDGTLNHFDYQSCADFGYDPYMYNLHSFLTNPEHGNFIPPFDQYQATGGFDWGSVSDPWNNNFGDGRRVTYNEQAENWYVNRGDQSRYMPFNNNNAIGYLDQVSDTGVASGWACDPDAPNGTVKVDFFINNVLIPEDPSQFPSSPSEPAVNNLCGGGSYHRFFVQLPPQAQGQPIYAVVRDYTTGPLWNLTCLEGPVCTW